MRSELLQIFIGALRRSPRFLSAFIRFSDYGRSYRVCPENTGQKHDDNSRHLQDERKLRSEHANGKLSKMCSCRDCQRNIECI